MAGAADTGAEHHADGLAEGRAGDEWSAQRPAERKIVRLNVKRKYKQMTLLGTKWPAQRPFVRKIVRDGPVADDRAGDREEDRAADGRDGGEQFLERRIDAVDRVSLGDNSVALRKRIRVAFLAGGSGGVPLWSICRSEADSRALFPAGGGRRIFLLVGRPESDSRRFSIRWERLSLAQCQIGHCEADSMQISGGWMR